MAYYNFVIPGSSLGGIGFIKRRAIDQMKVAAQATARQIEKLQVEENARLQTLVGLMRRAFGH